MNETLCCMSCATEKGLKLVGNGTAPYTTAMCAYCKQTIAVHMVDELVELRLIMLKEKVVPDTTTTQLLKVRKERSLENNQRGTYLLHKILRGRTQR